MRHLRGSGAAGRGDADSLAARRPLARVQGQCGSCWAHAATAAIESAVAIVYGTAAVSLSREVLIDCLSGVRPSGYSSSPWLGCKGGGKCAQVGGARITGSARNPGSALAR